MGDIIEALLKNTPSWAINICGGVIVAITLAIGVYVVLATKRYAENAHKEDKLIGLLEEKNELSQQNHHINAINEQLLVVIENTKDLVVLSNTIVEKGISDDEFSIEPLIQKVVEALASDIKAVVGEKHRVGFWMNINDEEENEIVLTHGSSGFPHSYILHKTLDINHSIAGRSLRKNEVIKVDNVMDDPDWIVSDTPSNYTALICIPIDNWGVVTIDAKEKMGNNTLNIGKLYCAILHNILEQNIISRSIQSLIDNQGAYREAATSIEEE
ncbi:hypothetical protein ACUUYQ_19595 [Bacillus halotolerans]|uniref:hypothetical protein n=1 Tax=Bacillus halotolerans TaxID=260554 RepID=UPI004045E225